MIEIRAERCDGCGACIEVCPEGAVYLVDGKATVDQTLCRECEVCAGACPWEAISFVAQGQEPAVEPIRVPALRPEPEVIRIDTRTAPVPLRIRVLPALGAALAWAGREIVPRMADYALYSLDQRAVERRASGVRGVPRDDGSADRRRCLGGQRHRRRRHGR